MSAPGDSAPPFSFLTHRLTLAQLQQVKNWHAAPQAHPLERQAWEVVMMLWVMGWMGWLPAYVFEADWAYPLCWLGLCLPRLYVGLRALLQPRLRCDWLHLLVNKP